MEDPAVSDLRDLCGRIAAGNEELWPEVVGRLGPLLESYARSRLIHKDQAPDVCQEVFLAISGTARSAFLRSDNPVAYAVVIARNEVIDRIRRTKSSRLLRDLPDSLLDSIPDHRKASFEAQKAIDGFAEGLPAQEAAVARLAAWGMGYRAIARELGLTEHHARCLVKQVRIKCRVYIEREVTAP